LAWNTFAWLDLLESTLTLVLADFVADYAADRRAAHRSERADWAAMEATSDAALLATSEKRTSLPRCGFLLEA
jgi:hypothetical protein